jgi:hypothetical protein
MKSTTWIRLIAAVARWLIAWFRRGSATSITELADQLPVCDLPDGRPWDRRENVRMEDGRIAIDLHGLSVREARAVTERALVAVPAGSKLRLITGHGRTRERGYSELRVALTDDLDGRRGVRLHQADVHREHRQRSDRLGHMDVDVG